MHVGIAGELRCVVIGTDGTVKTDTGYQKNLILNQGLDFFGDGTGVFNNGCVIGTGNSTPIATQTKLDVYHAHASATEPTSSYSYSATGDGLYKMWEQRKYVFNFSTNVNISEAGLYSNDGNAANYNLVTRVLIKDTFGAATSISIKAGETLYVYYKVHKVVEISDKSFVINMLDRDNGSVAYNAVVRPAYVGTTSWNSMLPIRNSSSITEMSISNMQLTVITSAPEPRVSTGALSFYAYTKGSYTLKYEGFAGLTDNVVGNIRTAVFFLNFMPVQVSFGSVSGGVGIPKTNKDTLSIPMELSWGRYEGEL